MSNTRKILKEARLALGLNRAEMSRILGYKSSAHVWQVETGYRDASVMFCRQLIKLCKQHNVMTELTLDDLLD